MNTQTQLHELQAGEALPLPRNANGRVVLVEGEVLFQAPALYLAGTVFVPPALRLSAPASWPLSETGSLQATRGARVLVEEAPGWGAMLKAALADLRRRYSVVMAPGGAGAQRT
jgi:hypothetical protein